MCSDLILNPSSLRLLSWHAGRNLMAAANRSAKHLQYKISPVSMHLQSALVKNTNFSPLSRAYKSRSAARRNEQEKALKTFSGRNKPSPPLNPRSTVCLCWCARPCLHFQLCGTWARRRFQYGRPWGKKALCQQSNLFDACCEQNGTSDLGAHCGIG